MSNLPLRAVKVDEGLILRSSGDVIDGVEIRRAKVIPDERGRLGEIMRADDPWFEKFGQVYFTTTYPGIVKAWHFHKKQTDHFYVPKGLIKVALYDERKESSTYGTVNQIYLGEHCPGLVRIPPGIQHGWMCVGNEEAYIINIVSEMYDYNSPDEYRTGPHDNHIPYDWERKDG
ncbi:dTDP-4-dehydrorhamnose 3,5-epimerase [Anaerohalosphaera lusitana]|uniref:dTDP-4-dehydrorhamnose 3,5-epimerase n=1 Tax=Anaerohalosphaera lusitana TaxID=1936003 RepID=A0A1U9NNE3_9BACT|nr:dTDP-4-dehydrorhamnose 3,5-epimerase family protein [Anaerohalosphaera lusitana]AQT69431.1 dTDP-4-dehydrorhamnose 3,5-epimerase [Anaerohalosphaera lusitana]